MRFPRSFALALLTAARDHERDGFVDVAAHLRQWAGIVASRDGMFFALAICPDVEWDGATILAHLDAAEDRARGDRCESNRHVTLVASDMPPGFALDPWQCPHCGAVYCRACEPEGANCAACKEG